MLLKTRKDHKTKQFQIELKIFGKCFEKLLQIGKENDAKLSSELLEYASESQKRAKNRIKRLYSPQKKGKENEPKLKTAEEYFKISEKAKTTENSNSNKKSVILSSEHKVEKAHNC